MLSGCAPRYPKGVSEAETTLHASQSTETMRRLLSIAATAALLASAGHLAAQTTDTTYTDYARESAEDLDRNEDVDLDYDVDRDYDLEMESEQTVAPGEYESRETRDFEDAELDTTGMTPNTFDDDDDRDGYLLDPEDTDEDMEPNGIPDPDK